MYPVLKCSFEYLLDVYINRFLNINQHENASSVGHSAVFGQGFKVGDKVEVYNSGAWYKATISQIGSDNYKGYYYVQFEKFSNGQWAKAADIKLVTAIVVEKNNGPRNGSYIVVSYSNPSNPIRIGYFELSNGQYTYYTTAKKLIGKGSFSYNASGKMVKWTSGPFKEAKWDGSFETDRDGKTHKIRLNSATIGSNSTDSNL